MFREARLWARDAVHELAEALQDFMGERVITWISPTSVAAEVSQHEARHALSMQGTTSNRRNCFSAVV